MPRTKKIGGPRAVVIDPGRKRMAYGAKVNYKASREALNGCYKTQFNREIEKLRVFPLVSI